MPKSSESLISKCSPVSIPLTVIRMIIILSKIMPIRFLFIIVLMLATLSAASAKELTVIREFTLSQGREISGIKWNKYSNNFLAVGDEGDFIEFDESGKVCRFTLFPSLDLEAVTVDRNGTAAYILDERTATIFSVSLRDLQIIRQIVIYDRDIKASFGARYSGLEGLDYDAKGIFGPQGSFLISNQTNLRGKKDKSMSGVMVYSDASVFYSFFQTDIIDCSDIECDPEGNGLWALSDTGDTLLHLDSNGKNIGTWNIPKGEQEGLAWNDSGLWIAYENGRIILVRPEL